MLYPSSPSFPTLVPFLLFLLLLPSLLFSTVDAQSDACISDLGAFLPAPFNASSGFNCTRIWNDFVLRYSQNKYHVLSVIVSSTYTSGWIGMGFSDDGKMVGSSAMVGWVGRDDKPHIREYYLGGKISSKVRVKKGNLDIIQSTPPAIAVFGPNLYMAFQLKFQAPITNQSILFAFGVTNPVKSVLSKHEDMTSIYYDFSPEAAAVTNVTYSFKYPYELKRNHGILAIMGWGVLLPIGAIVSRYCREWDPWWFYLHICIQFVGFIIGLAAFVTGLSLYDKLHTNVNVHRGIGIFVFVLGSLQVLAFFVKPNIDSKYRRYWNWYHHWFGRFTLFFAALNIALGIRAGGAAQDWLVGYGIILATILVTVVALETMFCLRSKSPKL